MKRFSQILLVIILSLSLVACGANEPADNAANQNNQETAQGSQNNAETNTETEEPAAEEPAEEESKETVYPLTVTDASGLEMTFEQAPEKIVSLSPSETEVLFALGLGDKVVGVTDWCDFPEEAKSKPKVGGLQGNVEAIIAAEPDLMMAGLSLNREDALKNYRELGLTVFTVEPTTIDEAMERILLIGQITNTLAQAEVVVAQMQAEKQSVLDAVAGIKEEDKKKVYIEFSPGWTVGSGEFMNELITLSGGINVAADQEGWIQISEEKIIQDNPDVILYSLGVENLEQTIRDRSGWDKIAAIQNENVAGVEDNLVSRPGPRVTQGLVEVAKGIYPDLVK
jgi:iron complex transport system substrate-binding protein